MTIGFALAAAAMLVCVAVGAAVAWWMHRRSHLSPWNAYLAWVGSGVLLMTAIATREPAAIGVAFTLLMATTTASVLGHRWRIAALGAGGELREHERGRVMVWTAI